MDTNCVIATIKRNNDDTLSDTEEVPDKKLKLNSQENTTTEIVLTNGIENGGIMDTFMHAFKSPLKFDDLDDVIDTVTPEQSLESQNFDQEAVMNRLITIAKFKNIEPQQLYSDIKTLIFAETQFKNQETVGDTIKTLKELKIKYGITELALEIDSITMFRLEIMFPQYSCLIADERLPHRVAAFMTLADPIKNCPDGNDCGNYKNLLSAYAIMRLPAGMKILAFASSLPTKALGVLTEKARQDVIVAHLVYQIILNYFIKKKTPFHSSTFHALLYKMKKQIQNGLLSDERRLRILQNMGVIQLNGVLNESIPDAIEHFKTRFFDAYNQINFRILGFSYEDENEETCDSHDGEKNENII